MTTKIFKYKLALAEEVVLHMPQGGRLLHVAEQDHTACLWAEVDTSSHLAVRRILICGTGHAVNFDTDKHPYIGTILSGGFVWHFYDGGET